MQSSSVDKSNKTWLDQTGTIIINSDHNEHSHKEWTSGPQANKLNAKYYLHVQHSTDTKTQGNCIKDIIHSDLCEFEGILTRGGNRYIISFIDDFSEHTTIYLLKN